MVQLKPSEIRYSQDSIRCVFTGLHSGKKIGETLDELVDGDVSVADIPTISVIFKNGKWFSYDNRRLWVLKHFELLGGCTEIYVTETNYLDWRKFTTYNEGTYVRVRGNPGGAWYYKYTRNPEKYKNYLQNGTINPYNKSYGPDCATSFQSVLLTNYPLSSLPLQAQNDWRCDKQGTDGRQLTNTLNAIYGFQKQPPLGYYMNEYTDKMVSRRTSVTGKSMFNNSSSSFSQDHVSLENSLRNSKQTSSLSSSDSTVTSNFAVPSKRNVSFPTNRSGERVTSFPTLSMINHDQYREKSSDASLSRPTRTVESSLPATKTKMVGKTKRKKSGCIIL